MSDNNSQESLQSTQNLRASILDVILDNQHMQQLQNFNPQTILNSMFADIGDRSVHIIRRRYGLDGKDPATLEAIGQELNLTRERIRQIEKETTKKLREQKKHPQLVTAHQLLTNVITEHGSIMHEEELIDTLLLSGREKSQEAAVRFVLELEESFEQLRHDDYHPSWYLRGFDLRLLHSIIDEMVDVLEKHSEPIEEDHLLDKVKETEHYQKNKHFYSPKALQNYMIITHRIRRNPFGKVGIHHWSSISPRDVGDKAYLVLKHHGKPEHYADITAMINKVNFDKKTAYKETVHNELIKDKRFVLVGRGIYALREWGYKPGVVADIITDILEKADGPLPREEIIEGVLKQRIVKRNTILVGLSNKKRFTKVGKDQYTLLKDT